MKTGEGVETKRMAKRGIQAVDHTFEILTVLAESDRPLALGEIARRLKVSKSFVQHYLLSLVRLGVVSHADLGGGYALGPGLIELGLAALNAFDAAGFSRELMQALRNEVGQTVALAVWSGKGPLFVAIEESLQPVNIGVRVGSHIDVSRSAVGRTFLAFLPTETSAEYLADPLLRREVAAIRGRGYGFTRGGVFPGIGAVSAPVFGQGGRLQAVLNVITTTDALDTAPDGKFVGPLLACAADLSKSLGFWLKNPAGEGRVVEGLGPRPFGD